MTNESLRRYVRNINVDGIGIEGQTRIAEGSVAIIGCGALGSLSAMQLAGSGTGRIRIVDFDNIDISNLQRQLFYTESETGCSKSETLASRIHALNSEVKVETVNKFMTESNSAEILRGIDFVIEATDNPASKYMVDGICRKFGLPVCIGGVEGMRGQVMTVMPDSKTRYPDLFGEAENPEILPCSIRGVIAPTAGIVASVQTFRCLD